MGRLSKPKVPSDYDWLLGTRPPRTQGKKPRVPGLEVGGAITRGQSRKIRISGSEQSDNVLTKGKTSASTNEDNKSPPSEAAREVESGNQNPDQLVVGDEYPQGVLIALSENGKVKLFMKQKSLERADHFMLQDHLYSYSIDILPNYNPGIDEVEALLLEGISFSIRRLQGFYEKQKDDFAQFFVVFKDAEYKNKKV